MKELHPSRNQYRELLFLFFIAALFSWLCVRFGPLWYLNPSSKIPGDFNVYWTASERFLQHQPIYRPEDPSPFKYSPTFLSIFYVTFFQIPLRFSAALWMTLSIASIALPFMTLGIMVSRLVKTQGRSLWIIAIAILISWRGFIETLSYGQADLFLTSAFLFWAFSILYSPLQRQKSPSTNFWITRAWIPALTLMIKPHFLLAFIPVFFLRPFREVFIYGVITVLAYLIPVFWIGPNRLLHLFGEWIKCLVQQQGPDFMSGNLNQSLAATLARLTGRIEWVGALSFILILGYLISTLIFLRRRRDALSIGDSRTTWLALAFGLSGYLLFSPLSWRWSIFNWVPVIGVLTIEGRARPYLITWAFIALCTHGFIGKHLEILHVDAVSFAGLYCGASLVLWIAVFASVLQPERLQNTCPSHTEPESC